MDSLLKAAQKLRTPYDVQKDLYTWSYNKKGTLWSAATALSHRSGHCLEAPHLKINMTDLRYKRLLGLYKSRGPMPRHDFWWSPKREAVKL